MRSTSHYRRYLLVLQGDQRTADEHYPETLGAALDEWALRGPMVADWLRREGLTAAAEAVDRVSAEASHAVELLRGQAWSLPA